MKILLPFFGRFSVPALLACGFALVSTGLAQETSPSFTIERVSLDSSGNEFTSTALSEPSISANGRYVVFSTDAALDAADTNDTNDVYLRDRTLNTTTLVSVPNAGGIGSSWSASPVISANGNVVAFVSHASNLVANDNNTWWDVFVRDLSAGTTTRVSVATGGAEGNYNSGAYSHPAISDDGRYVAFTSHATNFVTGDTNDEGDIFRHDRTTGTTIRVSIATDGTDSDVVCYAPAISGDGSKVAFVSLTDQFGGNPSTQGQIWLRDVTASTLELVSKDDAGTTGNKNSYNPDLSFDGRYVAYDSEATNLVTSGTSGKNVFLRDRQAGTTSLVNATPTGTYSNHSLNPVISSNGRYVAYESGSSQLTLGDTNLQWDIFVTDLVLGKTTIATRTSGFLPSSGGSHDAAITDTATPEVAFSTYATNLVTGDTNDDEDIYVSTPSWGPVSSDLIINEVDAVTSGVGGQFIELSDRGAGNTSLDGLVLVLYDGATDTSYRAIDLDTYSTDANGYFVVGSADVPGVDLVIPDGAIQEGVDAVALYYDNAASFPNGTPLTSNRILDAVVHENNQSNDGGLRTLLQTVSEPQADEDENGRATTESVQRIPDSSGFPGVTGVFAAYGPTPDGPNGVPMQLDLTDASDSGSSNSDDLTNITTPTITGVAPAGSTVMLFSSLDESVGSDTADASGNWSVTPSSALSEGSHQFTATADGGPAGSALAVQVDTTAPAAPTGLDLAAASDSGDSSTDDITNDDTPTVGGDAETGSTVTLTSDLDGDVGTGVASSPWSIVASTLNDGVHTVTAKATDAAGNQGSASVGLGVTIDTAGPTVTVEQAAGQSDPAGGAPVQFTATFSESVSGLDNGDVSLSGSASPSTPSATGSLSVYTLSAGGVSSEGTVMASIGAGAATDTAGNGNAASTSTDNTVVIDTHGGTSGASTAIVLAVGVGEDSGYIGTGDTDVFSFTLTAAKVVRISTANGVDTWGVLKNAAGDVLNDAAADDNRGATNNFRIDRALEAGTYYVEITGKGASPTGSYSVDVDATQDPGYQPDVLVGRSLAGAIGNDNYGPGQLVRIVTRKARPVNAVFASGNDGDLDDTFLLNGNGSTSLFRIVYSNAVDGNVTATVMAGTAVAGPLAPGDDPYLVNVRVIPNKRKVTRKKRIKRGKRRIIKTIYLRKTYNAAVGATSQADPLKKDTAVIQVLTR